MTEPKSGTQTRYARQLRLDQWGAEGQEKLSRARVLMIGAGGLASSSLPYLAGAGVGHLTLVDPDRIDLSNLPRQVLYTTADAGRLKVEVAKERLLALNPECGIEILSRSLDESLAKELFPRFDLILDGSDRMDCKEVINSVAHSCSKPWIYASVSGWEGRILSLDSRKNDSACMRCLHPKLKDGQIGTCEAQGVAGPVVGTVGSLQALEALRLLLGISQAGSSLYSIDGRTMSILEHRLKKNPECPVCSSKAISKVTDDEVLSLSVTEFLQAKERYHVIDLRSETERETHPLPAGTQATAWGAPGTEVPLPVLPADKTPVLLCRRGMMAYRVQAELARSGTSAIVLRGGMEAWMKEGTKS